MAWEPLGTDEKLEKPVKPVPDFDAQMISGCGSFVFCSVTVYALSAWPFFALQNTDQLGTLAAALGLGALPAVILGAIVTRRFGLAGACGLIGGGLVTAVFLYLRIQQSFLVYAARQGPRPEYPESFVGLVPLAVALIMAFVAVVSLPRREFEPDA